MNRESKHDLLKSGVIAVFAYFSNKVSYDPILVNNNANVFIELLQGIIVLFAFIAIGNAVSIVFISKKENRRLIDEREYVFRYTFGLVLIGVIAIGTIYSIIRIASITILSNVVFSITGFILGFSTSVEMYLEKSKTKISKSLLKTFDHSISNYLPLTILAICVVFPLDYFIENSELGNIVKFILCSCVILLCLYISYKLPQRDKVILEIQEKNNWPTEVFVIVLAIASIIGLQVYSYSILDELNKNENIITKIGICIISGLLPIRVIPIIWGKVSNIGKIINTICLGIYCFFIIK